MLVAAGYEVTGTTRSAEGAEAITAAGARPAIVDLFDRAALSAAMVEARPEVVIHQVTDLTLKPGRDLDDARLARNSHLREVGTRNLVEAAAAVDARRVIAQSIAWLYLPGPEPHTEDEAIVPTDGVIGRDRAAVLELERMVTTDPRFEGVVLRYGRLYGPGTWATTPPEPPTVHVDAAARAAALAVERGEPGIYQVVDDDGPVSNGKARTRLGWAPSSRRTLVR
jgi:nucleoside-diphosphate-sugar epimerase